MLNVELRQKANMPKSGQQASKADVGGQRPEADPKAMSPTTKPSGQKVSLERGKATHKKNPGKRRKSGGS